MLNWLHERDPIRYDVYCTLIKVAGKAGLMDQISFSLDQVDICIGKCLLIFTCIGCKYIYVHVATLYNVLVTIKICWLKSSVWPNWLILNYM